MIKYSAKFEKGLNDAIAWCDEMDAKIEADRIASEERKESFTIRFGWL